jgi:hypothetical protein
MCGQAILYVRESETDVTAWAASARDAGHVLDGGKPGVYVEFEEFAKALSDLTSKGHDAAGRIMAGDGHITRVQASGLALCVQEPPRNRFDEHRVADRHGKYDVLGEVVKRGGLEFVAGILAGIVDYNLDCEQRGWFGPINQTWAEGAFAAADHPAEYKTLANRGRLYAALTANALSDRDYAVVTAQDLQTLFDAVSKQGEDSVRALLRAGGCSQTEYTEVHKRAYNNAVKLIRAGFHPSEFDSDDVISLLSDPATCQVMVELRQRTAAA